jgi:hypothetical protein
MASVYETPADYAERLNTRRAEPLTIIPASFPRQPSDPPYIYPSQVRAGDTIGLGEVLSIRVDSVSWRGTHYAIVQCACGATEELHLGKLLSNRESPSCGCQGQNSSRTPTLNGASNGRLGQSMACPRK